MVRQTSLLPVAVASLLILFAGTAATTPDGLEETGDVQGRVFSHQLEPIEGALLELRQDESPAYSEQTDHQGFYSFEDVEPSTYRLDVSADGFLTHSTMVMVEADELIQFDFMLAPEPYVDGPHEWRGFISCWVSTALDCGAVDENHDTLSGASLDEGLETASFLLAWEGDYYLHADELRLQVRHDDGNVLAEATGTSPIQIRIDDGFEDATDLSFHVLPTDTSIVYQQTFTLWWALHYWAPAPAGYSPLPDA